MITVTYYRAVVFGRPRGPWRRELEQAHRDLIELGLGSYEYGQFFVTVPGDLQSREVREVYRDVA